MIKSDNKLLKIVSVYIASLYDVDTLTESGENASLTFKSTKDWEQIYYPDGTVNYNEPQKHPDAGLVHEQELKITVPGDDSSLQSQLNSYIGLPVVLRFDYDNGVSKIIGNFNNWIDLNSDFSSQNFETKRILSLTRISSKPALFLI